MIVEWLKQISEGNGNVNGESEMPGTFFQERAGRNFSCHSAPGVLQWLSLGRQAVCGTVRRVRNARRRFEVGINGMNAAVQSKPVGLGSALWLHAACFGVAYFLLAIVGHSLSPHPKLFVSCWLPSGLYVAALLLSPTRAWPVLILAACAGNLGFDLANGQRLPVSLAFCCGNSLEALTGAWLVRRFVAHCPTLNSLKEVLGLTAFSAVLSTTLSATIGAVTLTRLAGDAAWVKTWGLWWSGDAVGVLLIAPLVLGWAGAFRQPFQWPQPGRLAEGLAIAAAGITCAWFAGSAGLHTQTGWKYLVMPLILWAALRFGLRGVSMSSFIVAAVFSWHVMRHSTSLDDLSLPNAPPVIALQVFLAAIALMGLVLSSVFSERKQTERALRESTQVLEESQRVAGLGSYVLDVTAGTWTSSPVLEEIFGLSDPSFQRNVQGWLQIVHPDHREEMAHHLGVTVLTQHQAFDKEYRIVRQRDRQERWVHGLGKLTFGENGLPARMIGTIQDITARKQAEARMYQQAALLDQIQDAVLVMDLDRRLTYCNRGAERLYDLTQEMLLSKPVETLLFPEEPARFAQACQATQERGTWSGEIRLSTSLGTRRAVDTRWTLIRSATSQPGGFLIVNTDVSEKRRLEEQFLRAQRMESVGTLANGVAHDLNNILAPILMATDLLQPLARKANDQELVAMLQHSAQRGADIVNQLLTFGRGLAGDRVDLQLRSLLKETTKVILETFPKTISLEQQFPENLWTIHAEPTQIHQVLLNLCVNARDAMPDGGRLTLAAENLVVDEEYAHVNPEAKAGPYVVLQIGDTGSGIPPEVIDKVFDPFFTTKEPGQGTGLGLSTALGIVKSHQGFLQVISRVGKGTMFKVYLPALPGQETVRPAVPRQRLPHGHDELILLVEDEEAIRGVAQRILQSSGYRVVTATDGAEGLTLFSHNRDKIKVVITDMVMPVMDGAELIRSLNRLSPDLPVIAMSGLPDEEEKALKSIPAAGAFLLKPFSAEQLLLTLHNVLGQPVEV